MNDLQMDNALLGILQHCNSISNFLETIFSFLMRRTDFYYHCTPGNKNLGFPPGFNQEILFKTFKKYEEEFYKNMKAAADVRKTKEITDNNVKSEETTKEVATKERVEGAPECTVDENGENRSYQADADCYNGAVRSNYSWGQKIAEADIRIDVPEPYTSKDLIVDISKKRINIKGKNKGDVTSIIDKELSWEIKPDPSWYFEKKERKLIIDVEKKQERWWDSFFVDEEKINTRKIDCSRPITEIDEEGQAKIHQLMYDQRQKQMGKPTSEQQKINDTLKEAWNAEGSPFKGQPFDPSKLNISDGSSPLP